MNFEPRLTEILAQYHRAFRDKEFGEVDADSDVLMEVFGITPTLKQSNRQYWGRELGMCWQRICSTLCEMVCGDRFSAPPRIGGDEPFDFQVDEYAIDTKYRIGSGDSGTLKKFKTYGTQLRDSGLKPTLLILREDNFAAAITACRAGTWDVVQGNASFAFLKDLTGGFDLGEWLAALRREFLLVPPDPNELD